MPESEAADDRIERPIRERQVLDIAFAKFDARVKAPRELDHLGCEVDPDALRTASCGFGSDRTRPGRDIEKTAAGPHARSLQKRLNRQHRHRREEIMVAAGERAVASPLVCAQPLCVLRR
jgi:hypothetical protein